MHKVGCSGTLAQMLMIQQLKGLRSLDLVTPDDLQEVFGAASAHLEAKHIIDSFENLSITHGQDSMSAKQDILVDLFR